MLDGLNQPDIRSLRLKGFLSWVEWSYFNEIVELVHGITKNKIVYLILNKIQFHCLNGNLKRGETFKESIVGHKI